MGIGASFNETSLAFLLLVTIVFFSKERIGNIENKLYTGILITSLIGNAMAIPLFYIVKYYQSFNIATFLVPKLYLIYILIWGFLLSWYFTQVITKKDQNKVFKRINKIFYIYSILMVLVVFLLPIEYYSVGDVVYTYGTTVNFTYFVCAIHILYWFSGFILNFNKIKSKKCLPIIAVFVLGTFVAIIQKIDPSIRLMTVALSFVTTMMYFTIENPDLKIVNELYKNKNIMEQSYVDKSNFMFEMTQEVRDPLYNIQNVCNEVKNSNRKEDYANAINRIDKYSKQLDYIVNDVLNVNSLDVQQIKFIENKYNFNNIYDQIISQVKSAIKPGVKFNYAKSDIIPELYGDSIKIKQILLSLLLGCVHRTETGFIDFRVDTIERFDALRLVIQIKDSSMEIPIDVINDILNTTATLDEKDIELLERNEFDMELCQKVIKLMGGNLMIKSTKDKGTEIVLTIDQKIDVQKNEIGEYEKYVSYAKSVAIVTQDKKFNEYIRKFMTNNDIKSTVMLNGNFLIDDIKSGKYYDYIILANDMNEINGYTILKKLKEIKNFNIPVMLLLKDKAMANSFKDEGFSEILLLDNIAMELDRIISKY